ncbi:hypothetical protein CF326_g5727 [Tilletia indica]|nr:hypothetical protein CF326_g5727 [Tilletia indica]
MSLTSSKLRARHGGLAGRKSTPFERPPLQSDELKRADSHIYSGLARPLKFIVSIPRMVWLAILCIAGLLLGTVLLYQLVTFVKSFQFSISPHQVLRSLVKLIPTSKLWSLTPIEICTLPLANKWIPPCIEREQQQQELRRRAELAQSTKIAVKLTSGMLDIISKTPQAYEVQRISNGAYSLSQAFNARSSFPSAKRISQDLEKIGDETEKMIDNVLEVEVQGRLVVADLVAGSQQLADMLAMPDRYSANLVERQLNKFLDNADAQLSSLQVQLIAAQTGDSKALTLQRQLHGMLLTEQTDLQETHASEVDSRTFTASLRRWFDGNAAQPLTVLETLRLEKNLNLVNGAVGETNDWSEHFSMFVLYLRSYRSQVTARKRQLGQHQWTNSEMTVEDSVKAVNRLLQPLQERLERLERGAGTSNEKVHAGTFTIDGQASLESRPYRMKT